MSQNKTKTRITYFLSSLLLLMLISCGGGGDSAPATNPGTGVVVNNGLFDVNLIEGLTYQSGGQSGETDTTGKFSYEQGKNVVFKIGDIVVGDIPAQARLSIINLVPGAMDENNETVTNLARFLLTIDDDANPANGIRVRRAVAVKAIGVTVNFAQTTAAFETDAMIQTIVSDMTTASMAGVRTLVTTLVARNTLRNNLLTAFSGIYDGAFSGDDNGTWSIIADANGVISGDGVSNSAGAFSITGKISTSGNATFSLGGTSTGASFKGVVQLNGKISGTWSNVAAAEKGTFSGAKLSSNGNGGNTGGGGSGNLPTKPFLNAMMIYNTVTANINGFLSAEIVIKAPAIAENGAVVPVSITNPAQKGTLWVFVDSNVDKPAARIDILTANSSPEVTDMRLKMAGTGNIIVVFDDGSGNLRANTVNVKVTIPSGRTACPVTPCVVPDLATKDVRVRSSNGVLKMLFGHPMYSESYITSVAFSVDTVSKATVFFTPYISKNPYLRLNYPVTAVDLAITVIQTGGSSVTVTSKAK